MDRRSKTTAIAAALTLLLAPLSVSWAQNNDAEPAPTAEGTNIFGNQELPKGLTIVPWKKSDPGQLSSGPTRLVDEPLEPIDPDVFERRLKYYEQTHSK